MNQKEFVKEMKILYQNEEKKFSRLLGNYFELPRATKIYNFLSGTKMESHYEGWYKLGKRLSK